MATDVSETYGIEWGDANKTEVGYMASVTSNEQLTLIGMANQLGSSIVSNEPGIADEGAVRREAKLLMSLSCRSPDCMSDGSGRTTPESVASSCASVPSSTRRNTFRFTCPSLSLENPGKVSECLEGNAEPKSSGITSAESPLPAVLLGRSLKVEDRDALRLSAEAMTRNLMQSYQKALQWRIQAWIDSLSTVLVEEEKGLKEKGAAEDEIKGLLETPEAKLVLKLRELAEKIQVIDARTAFKVHPRRIDCKGDDAPPSKKQRSEPLNDMCVLEETEYKYHVAHSLALEGFICVFTPAGFVHIDVQVPGSIKGTFLSSDPDFEEVIGVKVQLNTDILAAMIEKSSRITVRSSIEALIEAGQEEDSTKNEVKQELPVPCTTSAPIPTFTPKRKFTNDERSAGLVVVTPRETSSDSSYGDSDHEEKPVLLSIPDDFKLGSKKTTPSLRMVSPQPSRPHELSGMTFTHRLPSRKTEIPLPSLVSPHKIAQPAANPTGGSAQGNGPCLPVLVEVACAAMHSN